MTSASKQQTKSSADNLIALLRDNPNLFIENPELLELINLPDDRGTSSLLEQQIKVLRKRISVSKEQQQQMFDVARQNEAISDNFAPVICQLIAIDNMKQFAIDFPAALKQTFKIDHIGFKLASSLPHSEQQHDVYQQALRRLVNNKTVCDNRLPNSILSLFFKSDVSSAALIPLLNSINEKPFGILALGSDDPERYTPELGTVHLNRLGLMTGICLSRLKTT